MMTQSPVQIAFEGPVAVVRVDNPPVNALGAAVRQGLAAALSQIEARADLACVLLLCEGRTFFAGADIREFDGPMAEPGLPELCSRIEAARVPWLAALHGTVLGGGLEVALACRWRVAAPGTRLGLPEVLIGVIPGAGGTVRLPRVVGVARALEMITTGASIDAATALAEGLVDALAEGDLETAARTHLAQALSRPLPPATGARPAPAAAPDFWDSARAQLAARAAGAEAPLRAFDSVRHATTAPLAGALAFETAQFRLCHGSPQARALQHLFFVERGVARPAEIQGITPARGRLWSRDLPDLPRDGDICIEDHATITARLAEMTRDTAPDLLAALVPALARAGLTPLILGAPVAGALGAILARGDAGGLARFGWPAGDGSGGDPDPATRATLRDLVAHAQGLIAADMATADQIDLITVQGLGLARWRGGLMHWARGAGLA
jgi:enoyl-CoA hydratase/carnithine racemase